MKIYFNFKFEGIDFSPFYKLFNNIFNETIENGDIEDSEILIESIFTNSVLYHKNWRYSFLFIGESDRRLPLFIPNGLHNSTLKDYSCIFKGKSENDFLGNIINFPLFVLYSYAFNFIYQLPKRERVPQKNVCVIISNGADSEGRNFFLDELDKKIHVDYAGSYKNNVPRVQDMHCSPGFIDFVSQYKIIITMENSKNNNYITEKILEGFAANTIPVYWGADNIGDYFNKERFINVNTFNISDIQEAIDKILRIVQDDNLFLEMIRKPIYTKVLKLNDIANETKQLLQIDKSRNHFITFGNEIYHNSVRRICQEANTLHFFDEIKGFTETDLQNDFLFWNKHGQFILNNKRGYGYWIWKSYLIKQKLEQLNENDILVYCDAGCQVNPNGVERLNEYVDMLRSNKENYGLLSFQLNYNEEQYTKRAIFDIYECSKMLQNMATIVLIKKNNHSINVIREWYSYCENYNLINDFTCNEIPEFIENRHDQSILSVLVNKYGSIKLLDETYFTNWNDGREYPFLAKRLR